MNHLKIQNKRSTRGFTIVELIASAAIIGVLASVTIMGLSAINANVQSAKLTTDVTKLNQLVTTYLATGGSLAGVTTAQGVLDAMKTTRTAADAPTEVQPETGRFVDIRLAAQTSSAAATASAPQAFWNSTTQKFTIATTGSGGVTQFYLNDALAANNYGTQARTPTNEQYNASPGWVWAAGNNQEAARQTPLNASGIDYFTAFNPLPSGTGGSNTSSSSSSGSGSSTGTTVQTTTVTGSKTVTVTTTVGIAVGMGVTGTGIGPNTLVTGISGNTVTLSNGAPGTGTFALIYANPTLLPTPIINPKGGSFYQAFFPSLLSINPNGAASSVSTLQYNINGGPWMTYQGPFAVAPQSTVQARNLTLNTATYTTSGIDTEPYYVLFPAFTGNITAIWAPPDGPSAMTDTTNNSNAALVVQYDGTGAQGYNPGQNLFTFAPAMTFTNVPPNTQFLVGTMNYTNGTINSGTGATQLNLQIYISMSNPLIPTASCIEAIPLTNTVNASGGTSAQNADYITLNNPTTSWSITQNGVVYTLTLAWQNINNANGWTSGSTLYVYEGATATAQLYGTFVSTP